MTLLHRAAEYLGVQTRDSDNGEGREVFRFCAATEAPVGTWRGPEVLKIRGMGLERYERNPVVLDAHNSSSIDDVIGRATVQKQGSELLCDIEFDTDDPRGERAANKVRNGFLRAVSVGYTVDPRSVREVREGETRDGVKGPAVIAGRSTLFEISVVPVPADENAIRRSFYSAITLDESEAPMADATASEAQATPVAEPTIEPPKVRESETPEAKILNFEQEAERLRLEREQILSKARAEAREAAHAEIRQFCPASMREDLETLLLEQPDVTVDAARSHLVGLRADRLKPVGTDEPADATPSTPAAPSFEELASLFSAHKG